MNSEQYISIITCTKDRPELMYRCLKSVQRQDHEHWEHIIVNYSDSNSELERLLEMRPKAQQAKTRIIQTENQGYANNVKLGIERAAHDTIVILDDDDGWNNNYLEQSLNQLKSKRVDAVLTNFTICTEQLLDGFIQTIGTHQSYPDPYFLNSIVAAKPFPSHSLVFRKELVKSIPFINSLEFWAVWGFILQTLVSAKVHYNKASLVQKYVRKCKSNGVYKNTALKEPIQKKAQLLKACSIETYNKSFFAGLKTYTSTPQYITEAIFTKPWQQKIMQLAQKVQRRGYHELLKLRVNKLHFYQESKSWIKSNIFKRSYGDFNPDTDALSSIKVVSFDIFDTLIHRKSITPEATFLLLQNHLQKRYEDNSCQFATYRKQAEQLAREKQQAINRAHATTLEDVSMEQIYTEFCLLLDLPKSEIPGLIKAEQQIELNVCYPNPHIQEFYRRCISEGKRIIYTSDMYLPAPFIKKLLLTKGYDDFKLYLSSLERKTKHSGTLFDYVLKEENIKPDQLLHVGDNIHADINIASAKGIRTYYLQPYSKSNALYLKHKGNHVHQLNSPLESVMLGTVLKGESKNPYNDNTKKELWKIGYELVGPNHLSYLNFIINKTIYLGLEKIHFLARDGYYLNEAFKLIKTQQQLPLASNYLLASRHLYTFPMIKEINEIAIYKLITPFQRLKVKDLLLRIGMHPEKYKKTLGSYGFNNLDAFLPINKIGELADPKTKVQLCNFFLEIKDDILKEAKLAFVNLLEYIEENKVDEKTAIVDVGWQGSSISSLTKLLKAYGKEGPYGFFFGTWGDITTLQKEGIQLDSFYFHAGRPNYRAQHLMTSVAICELFFTAPHPTVISLKKDANSWDAVYEEEALNEEEQQIKEIVFEGSMQFITDLLEVSDLKLEHCNNYIQVVNNSFFRSPSATIASILGKYRHKISYGSISSLIPIARTPNYDLRGSQWKKHKKDLLKETLWIDATKSMLKDRPRF